MEIAASRRRVLLLGSSAALAVAALPHARGETAGVPAPPADVGAVEDLMREHGVLRRALVVYGECAARLQRDPTSVDAAALNRTTKLFRAFGEDYHERKLEEAYVFPRLEKAGRLQQDVHVLHDQHDRGREINAYVMRATAGAHIGAADAPGLANALRDFVRMYAAHAAREDTVVFPAWKALLSADELDEAGERFEDIEHDQFGGDGFDMAVAQIAEIERALGLADLALFTAPAPR